MSEYIYADADNRSRTRLAAIAAAMDPGTFEVFEEIGVTSDNRCLDVGAGVGSVAEWLANRSAVPVVATDVDVGWLKALQRADIEVREHDITTGPVEPRGFDLVHARTVLTHLRERHVAIENLIASTRPGGWLVLEDPDMATMGRSYPEEELNDRFCRTLEGLITACGGDPRFGMRLPEALFAAGLEDVGFRVRMPPSTGKAGLDHLEGIAERLIANAIFTPDEIQRLTLFLQNDRVVLHGPAIVAAWGRIPEPS